jgi:WD40 repeat protein
MMYGLDFNPCSNALYAADDHGRMHIIDRRAKAPQDAFQAHTARTKINCLSVHPIHNNYIVSCGNDKTIRLFDVRRMRSKPPPAFPHSRIYVLI